MMARRLWWVTVLASASLMTCSAAPCGPLTCYGCCSDDGQCLTAAPNSCGANGSHCVTCREGQLCTAGLCAGQGIDGGAGGHGGGREDAGGSGGGTMRPSACAQRGETCVGRAGSGFGALTCCSFGSTPQCSAQTSTCVALLSALGSPCTYDSECSTFTCDRSTRRCIQCKSGGAACGATGAPCCNRRCESQLCAACRGPNESCQNSGDCCSKFYCNQGRCYSRYDGGVE